ncbi:hypothetical protein [Streptomyces sp. cg35]
MGGFVEALLVKVGLMVAEVILARLAYELYWAYVRNRQAGTATV